MKYICLLFLIALSTKGFCSPGDSLGYAVSIKGKIYHSNDSISKRDLKNIATLEIVDTKTQQKYVPVSFEFVVMSTAKNTWKGGYNMDGKGFRDADEENVKKSQLNFFMLDALEQAGVPCTVYIHQLKFREARQDLPARFVLIARN
ncbi:MAG: hypothetical protein JWO06_2030 [Bacteroidota bacterium]|nr:hypothetical protein [Bacteroidota bacterium]